MQTLNHVLTGMRESRSYTNDVVTWVLNDNGRSVINHCRTGFVILDCQDKLYQLQLRHNVIRKASAEFRRQRFLHLKHFFQHCLFLWRQICSLTLKSLLRIIQVNVTLVALRRCYLNKYLVGGKVRMSQHIRSADKNDKF